jgi:hypothetical protein
MRLLAIVALTASFAIGQTPTFYKDVAPVFQKHCQECHRAGEAAPMPLLTYADARPWAKAIKQAVLSNKMPPWYADPHFGKWSNDRSLSKAEIDTLVAWVDGGAKEGNPEQAPAPLTFAEGWTIGKPDVVIDMGVDFKVPAQGTVAYTYFAVPTGFTEDKWIQDLEVRPGNRAVVHHIVLFSRPKNSKFMAGINVGVPFVEKKGNEETKQHPAESDRAQLFGIGMDTTEMIGVFVPGGVAYKTLPGQARLIPAGSDLVFQIHYTANGKEGLDRSKVAMTFAKEPPKERVINAFIMNMTLHIPPGDPNHRVDGKVTLQEEAKLQSLFPHMHLRGKAFEYTAKYPTGETETLLKVPKYDFNWQLTYYLEKPLILPKGTQLTASAFYDNSSNNPFNPDPKKDVYWGDQSWEEMLAGFVDFAIPVDMNPVDLVRPKKTDKPASTGSGSL